MSPFRAQMVESIGRKHPGRYNTPRDERPPSRRPFPRSKFNDRRWTLDVQRQEGQRRTSNVERPTSNGSRVKRRLFNLLAAASLALCLATATLWVQSYRGS